MTVYDVVVIGAGPVGSTFAREMSLKGYKVVILDKKRKIGVPLQCAGLLAKKIKEWNILPDEYILNEVKGAFIHSPSDDLLRVSKKDTAAYVIDRVGYDQFLAKQAVESGVELLLGHKVQKVDDEGNIQIKNGKTLSGQIIVGADGHSSIVSSSFNPPDKSLSACQFLVEDEAANFDTDYVHLHVNSKLAPGFIWIIPLTSSTVRIGLFGEHNYHKLNSFILKFLQKSRLFKNPKILKKYQGRIPVYDPKKKLHMNNKILLGDAASQVKPTTGGGLLIGFKCASLAVPIVSRVLENGEISLLSDYEKEFRKEFRKELNIQLEVQKTYSSLRNKDLDHMFIKLKEENAEQLISQVGDIDDQSPLIKEMWREGLLLKILPRFLPTLLVRRIKTWKY